VQVLSGRGEITCTVGTKPTRVYKYSRVEQDIHHNGFKSSMGASITTQGGLSIVEPRGYCTVGWNLVIEGWIHNIAHGGIA
jgi:hypothetical protein